MGTQQQTLYHSQLENPAYCILLHHSEFDYSLKHLKIINMHCIIYMTL